MTSLGIGCALMVEGSAASRDRPNARFPTFDGQLAAHQQPMVDVETRPAKLADLRYQLHDVAEPRRGDESRAGVDQRNADDPESAG